MRNHFTVPPPKLFVILHHIFSPALLTEEAHTDQVVIKVSKAKDYAMLFKLRLSFLVVFSAVAGYFLAATSINWLDVFYLALGGFLVTGASNGFNQVIEKELDKLMDRTKNRPLAAGRMASLEALVTSALVGSVGLLLLWFMLNPLSGVLGALALFLYVAVYTPLKRITPWAVFVGAFPGAIPPMLGWVAYTGKFGIEPGVLFVVQFMWQFPHFWAIAWKMHDDYKKAGFSLLPSPSGRGKASAFQVLIYSLFLIPASLLPTLFGVTGTIAAIAAFGLGVWFFAYSLKLYKTLAMEQATKLMFASFIYLPLVLIVYIIDKFI